MIRPSLHSRECQWCPPCMAKKGISQRMHDVAWRMQRPELLESSERRCYESKKSCTDWIDD